MKKTVQRFLSRRKFLTGLRKLSKSLPKAIFLLTIVLGMISVVPLCAEVTTGQPAPDFTLSDTNGAQHSLSDFKGKFVVLEWVNPDCPFVKKHYESQNMQNLQKTYTEQGVVWLSINSSAEGKQGHYRPEEFNQLTAKNGANPLAFLLDFEVLLLFMSSACAERA